VSARALLASSSVMRPASAVAGRRPPIRQSPPGHSSAQVTMDTRGTGSPSWENSASSPDRGGPPGAKLNKHSSPAVQRNHINL
jgi:hypothetical protein